MLQSDNGPEFSTYFTEQIRITHRHTRVRKPNDNAHIERFNRTVQEECLCGVLLTVSALNKVLHPYLSYYNERRLHFGIDLQTPAELLTKCFQGID
jgi:transposase InsO family protein